MALLLIRCLVEVVAAQEDDAPQVVAAEIAPAGPLDLVTASRTSDLEGMLACVGAGIDIDQTDPIHGVTPLSWAAAMGHGDAVDLLLRAGADVNARNRDGASALHVACFFGQPGAADRLLNQGADVNAVTHDGATPLDVIEADWEVTRSIANALGIHFDEQRVAVGRQQAGELLLRHGAKGGGGGVFALTIVLACVAGGLSIVGLVLWLVHLSEKRRTEMMRAVAAEIGLKFTPMRDAALLAKLQGFSLFNRGYGRKMKNVMKAETEMAQLTVFDYQYTTGGGKHSQTHHQTVVAMESDSLCLPEFTLRPEGLLDKIGSTMGFQDIDFESHPEFSRLFVLKGKDEEAVRNFFDADMLAMLTQQGGATIDCDTGLFIYLREGRRKPEEIQDFMSEGFRVYKAFERRLQRTQPDPSADG